MKVYYSQAIALARKECQLFFGGASAYLFLALFLAVSLFVFFWVELWFVRGVADVRPLFDWMSILLIFLSSAITMRLFSEERRSGTLDFLLSMPTPIFVVVLGKFLACLVLLVVALSILLLLPLSIQVGVVSLDWGPIMGGFLATFLMGATYMAIGLYASSRSDNPIVCLLLSMAIGVAWYLPGVSKMTSFLGTDLQNFLWLWGSGARFSAIARGVLDGRDLLYYVSLSALFLLLTIRYLSGLSLVGRTTTTKLSWQDRLNKTFPRVIFMLIVVNIVAINVWIYPLGTNLRFDLTANHRYSLSKATEKTLSALKEPVLIRAYFSSKTHPLLAPLQGELKDILTEIALKARAVSGAKVVLEIVDPTLDSTIQEEAVNRYGIRPLPFRVNDRYQASVVSSYFHVLIKMGDVRQTLSLRELIDFKVPPGGMVEVALRNPEYDVVRALQKIANDYDQSGSPFAGIRGRVELLAFSSAPDKLPTALRALHGELITLTDEWQKNERDRFSFRLINPTTDKDFPTLQKALPGIELLPVANAPNGEPIYFQMVARMKGGDNDKNDKIKPITVPDSLQPQALTVALFEAVRSFSPHISAGGKRIAFMGSTVINGESDLQNALQSGALTYEALYNLLGQSYQVEKLDSPLQAVNAGYEVVIVAGAKGWDPLSVKALSKVVEDGGKLILFTSPNHPQMTTTQINIARTQTGLEEWLSSLDVFLSQAMVLDSSNSAFPTVATKSLPGGSEIQESVLAAYPYFVSITGKGYAYSPIASSLSGVVLPWVSAIHSNNTHSLPSVNPSVLIHDSLRKTPLLQSTDSAWLNDSLQVVPTITEEGKSGYTPKGERGMRTLALMVEGRFPPYQPKGLPAGGVGLPTSVAHLWKSTNTQGAEKDENGKKPKAGQMVIIASNAFATDATIQLQSMAMGQDYRAPLHYTANLVDWLTGDESLLSIRGRSLFGRMLPSLTDQQRRTIEWGNYGLGLLGLIGVLAFTAWQRYLRRKHFMVKLGVVIEPTITT